MSMTPDEKFNHDVWWILQEIRRERLYTLKEERVNFALRLPLKQSKKIDDGIPSAETQRKLLSKLKEWGAFDLEPTGIYFDDQPTAYLLVIHQSKFDELYGKYKESCDLQTYLNTRQQKMYDNLVEGKGEQTDLPRFLNPEDKTTQAIRSPGSSHAHTSLSDVRDRGMEHYYKDEIQLVNKLLQVCNEKTKTVVLSHPAHLANNNSVGAGFDEVETLRDLTKQYRVFSGFDPSLNLFSKGHAGIFKASVDYQKLHQRAEALHDEVESWKGTVYGIEEQKKRILERLQDRFRKKPQEEYTYSEWLLGPYIPRIESAPLGTSLSSPDPNRTDIRYQFMRAMRELEKDGHFDIINVKIDFSAKPEPTGTSLNVKRRSLGDRSLEFIPARHCKITLRPTKQKQGNGSSIIIKENLSKEISGRKKPKCETRGGVGYVRLGEKESKPFKKLKGRQWKLVKQLVEFFDSAKTDEAIYESIEIPSDSTRYPEILDSYRSTSRIHTIIENAIAEIQRNFSRSGLAGLFSIHHDKKRVWMNFLQ